MNYRNSRTIMWILLGVGGLLAFISTRREMPKWVVAIAAACMLLGPVIMSLFYRCPSCGSSLSEIRGPIPYRCPYCGATLREPKATEIPQDPKPAGGAKKGKKKRKK